MKQRKRIALAQDRATQIKFHILLFFSCRNVYAERISHVPVSQTGPIFRVRVAHNSIVFAVTCENRLEQMRRLFSRQCSHLTSKTCAHFLRLIFATKSIGY